MAFDIFGTNGDKSKQIQYKISNNANRVIGMGGSNDPFLKDHVIDVYAKDVVNVFEVAKDVSLDEVIYDNSMDDYDLIFDIALLSLSVCAIIVVCKITKK